jgi:hypothetical protein
MLGTFQIQASPTIIQDPRISNTGLTPMLGRGYSLSTNSFQSNCFSKIEKSIPSYDFVYQFSDKESFLNDETEESSLNLILQKIATESFKHKIFKQTKNDQTEKASVKIIASIQLNSYYASLDESQATLSASAASLVKSKDLPGFFSSCGSYYIKSMIRNAVFLAEFQFESIESKSDLAFMKLLEANIKKFKLLQNNADLKQENDFSFEAGKRKLTILVAAFGLGFNSDTALISYDFISFKAAIKSALIAMQNPDTGKVTAIEVIPWIENSQFQSLLFADDKENTPQYEKKYNISLNAGILSEIEKVDRGLMDTYYKAKICRRFIDNNWKQNQENRMKLKPVYQNRYLMNNNDSSTGIRLATLDKYLSKERIEQFYQKHQTIIYGKGKQLGARKCISELHKVGLENKNYRDLKPCFKIEKQLINFNDSLVDDYCMPVLFDKQLVPQAVSVINDN